jgi:hypothetical protein
MLNYSILKDIFLICFALLSSAFILGRLVQKITYRLEIALNIFVAIDRNLTTLNERLKNAVAHAESRHTEHPVRTPRAI